MVGRFLVCGVVVSVLLVSSCATGASGEEVPQESSPEEVVEEFVFNEDYFNNVLLGDAEHTPYGWEFVEGIHDYSLNAIETDEFGTYKRVRVSLKQEYIDAIPLVYDDGTPIDDISEEDMRDAIRLFTDFVLNETLDSIALDNPDRYMEWADTVGKEYFTVPMLQEMKAAHDPWGVEPLPEDSDPFWLGLEEEYGLLEGNNLNNYDATPGLLYDGSRTEYLELPDSSLVQWSTYHFPLMRDGESRTSNRHLSSISFEQMDSTNFPRIYIRSNAFVRTNAETAIMGDYYNYEPDDYDNSSSTTSTDLSLVVGYTLVKPKEKWQIAGYFIEDIIWPRSSSGYPEENWTPTTDLRNDLRYVGLVLE